VIVASNAFGLGIDQPNVRVVIHIGPIYRMRDYGQESGRGRRDGQPSEAIILIKAGRQEALQEQFRRPVRRVISSMDKAQIEQEKVDRFISGMKCRRIHLDQEMDGRLDRIRCEEGEERCDVCQKDDEAAAEAEELQQAFAAQEQMLDSAIDIPSSSIMMQGSENASPSSSIDAPSSIELPDISRFANQSPLYRPQKSPTSSVTGSDPEFETDLITIADQYEYKAQQAEREQQRKSIQRQNQQEGHEVWELERQLEEWSGRCALCFIRGHKDSRHSINNCVQRGSSEIRKGWQEMKKLMAKNYWFELFSCCFDCHVPQAIC